MIDPDAGLPPTTPPQPPYAPRPYTPYPATPETAPTTETTNPTAGLGEGLVLGGIGAALVFMMGLFTGNVLLDLLGIVLLIGTGVGGYGLLKYRLWRDQLRHDRHLVTIKETAKARSLPVDYQTQRDIIVARDHERTIRKRQKYAFKVDIERFTHELEMLRASWETEAAKIALLTPQRLIETLAKLQTEQLKILAEMRRLMETSPGLASLIETVFVALDGGTKRMAELHDQLLDPAVQANPTALGVIQQEIATMGATTAAVVAGFFQNTYKIKLPTEETK